MAAGERNHHVPAMTSSAENGEAAGNVDDAQLGMPPSAEAELEEDDMRSEEEGEDEYGYGGWFGYLDDSYDEIVADLLRTRQALRQAIDALSFNGRILPQDLESFPDLYEAHQYAYGESDHPAATAPVASLVELKYEGGGKAAVRCVICMEDFEDGDDLRVMPCMHKFHQNCLTKWLECSHLCPLCRYKLPTN